MSEASILVSPAAAPAAAFAAAPVAEAPKAAVAPVAPAPEVPKAGAAPVANGSVEPVAEAVTPAPWYAALGVEDEKTVKRLGQFASLADYDRAFADTQTALRNKQEGMIKLPGANATDAERAAFQKALGIPEAPDKYEIKVKPPEGLEIGESDKAFLAKATAKLHAAGGFAATPEVANLAHELYFEAMQEQAATMAAAAASKMAEGKATLQKLYGQNYGLEMKHAEHALVAFGPRDPAAARAMLDRQFADGTRLGDDPEIVQLLVRAARATHEDPMLLDTLSGGLPNDRGAIQQQIDEIMKTKGTPAYDAKADQLRSLLAQRERISGKG